MRVISSYFKSGKNKQSTGKDLAHPGYETRADHSLDPPTKTDLGLNRCSTTRQDRRTAPSPGVEVDYSNRNSKIQTLGEGFAEAPFSSNKNVRSRHYSAPSLLGSTSLPREIGLESTSYNLLVAFDKQVRHSTFCASLPASSPHKFLFGTKRGPPKNGEKEMNDGGESDSYNKVGCEVVADSSSYDSLEYAEKLQEEIANIVDANCPQEPTLFGREMSFIQFAPWMIRLTPVTKH
ncbi:hypothetical protein BGZ57DRAFT_980096 [Hyaloscypha finlandica]|nr:hypothetical protein BGZ57DRAFT_980096 [Hyaloscypha finlandica]KAH8790998.1 hypothetical protein F5882DRAFT_438041 [Hyaloscypha sp. PMI_1271]